MKKTFLFAATIALICNPALSQQVDPIDALKELTTAVCEPIANINSGNLIKKKFDAEAAVNLEGVLKRFASVGLEGAASFDTTEYVNGLASDALAGEIGSQRDCNLRIYNDFSGPIKTWITSSSAGVSVSIDGDCDPVVTGNNAQVSQNCTISK